MTNPRYPGASTPRGRAYVPPTTVMPSLPDSNASEATPATQLLPQSGGSDDVAATSFLPQSGGSDDAAATTFLPQSGGSDVAPATTFLPRGADPTDITPVSERRRPSAREATTSAGHKRPSASEAHPTPSHRHGAPTPQRPGANGQRGGRGPVAPGAATGGQSGAPQRGLGGSGHAPAAQGSVPQRALGGPDSAPRGPVTGMSATASSGQGGIAQRALGGPDGAPRGPVTGMSATAPHPQPEVGAPAAAQSATPDAAPARSERSLPVADAAPAQASRSLPVTDSVPLPVASTPENSFSAAAASAPAKAPAAASALAPAAAIPAPEPAASVPAPSSVPAPTAAPVASTPAPAASVPAPEPAASVPAPSSVPTPAAAVEPTAAAPAASAPAPEVAVPASAAPEPAASVPAPSSVPAPTAAPVASTPAPAASVPAPSSVPAQTAAPVASAPAPEVAVPASAASESAASAPSPSSVPAPAAAVEPTAAAPAASAPAPEVAVPASAAPEPAASAPAASSASTPQGPVTSPSTASPAQPAQGQTASNSGGVGQFTPQFESFVRSGPTMPGPLTAQYPTLAPRTAQVWSVPKPKKKPLPIFESVVAGAGAALMIVGVLGFLQASGPVLTVFLAILCIVPLAIVVSLLLFIDRFEPEPLGMKLAALAWGGGVSVFFAIMGNEYVQYSVTEQTGDEVQGIVFSVVVGAPVVEELLKGLGVLVIVWARRTHISSAIDGLIYAGFAACGFLVVEDFTYFVRAVLTDGDLGQLFFQRVVMGVFGHVMYTSCMGWATGWAVTRARSAAAGCGAVALGWFTGMLLHATWNGTAVLSGGDEELFYTFYMFIHIPLFLLWFLFIALAMKRERRDAAAGLMPYVAQGWIIPAEIQMVCDPRSRRAALAWASNGGPLAKKAMKQFMYALATLGLHQVVMKNRGPEKARITESRELAKEATSQRKIFMKLTRMRRF